MSASDAKNIIITGGSRGIGFAVAEAFAKQGARVLLVARNKEELEGAKARLSNALVAVADVSDEEHVATLAPIIEKDFEGRVDILVNAAGIYGPMGLLEETNTDHWKMTFEVNVFGTMLMCRLVLPFMKKNGVGRIINFSGGGEGAFPRFTAYSASKGAILRFTESLAGEVKEYGITVNAIAPGAVNTSLLEEILRAGEEKVGTEFYKKSLEQKESGGVSPEKAAEMIVFLASSDASHITGKMISAVHDRIEILRDHREEIASSDIYNVRRIKPKDRNKQW